MPTLSLCMIVRDEEEVLARCLESAAGVADELIVVDTGSRDRTAEIALDFGARVERMAWADDFAAARNRSFALATQPYILWLDADDVLLPRDRAALIALKPRLDRDVYYLPYDYAQDAGGRSLCTLYRERIVRNSPAIRWHHPVHEYLGVTAEMRSEKLDITVTHRRTPRGVQADGQRNRRILEKAVRSRRYRSTPRLHYYLARDYQDAGEEQQAIASFHRFLSLGGWIEDRIGAWQRLAVCHYRLAAKDPPHAARHRALARSAAKEARRLDARWAEPHFLLGQLAFDEGDLDEAVFWYERALVPPPPVLSPLDPHAYTLGPAVQLCICHDRRGDARRANFYNEVALGYRPGDAGLLYNRGYLRKRLWGGGEKLRLAFAPVAPAGWTRVSETPDAAADDTFRGEAIPCEAGRVASLRWELPLDRGGPEGRDLGALCREWARALAPGGEVVVRAAGGAELPAALAAAELVIDQAARTREGIAARALKPVHAERVGFVAAAQDLRNPQFRLRVYHVDRWLRSRGYRSSLIGPAQLDDCDTLVFFRAYNAEEHALMLRARQAGRRVLLDVCEDLFDLPFEWYRPMLAAADTVIACSHVLAEKVRAVNPRVQVIEDAVEVDFARGCRHRPRKRLVVAWLGMGGNSHHAARLRPLIERAGHQLVTIHEHADADVAWTLDGWQEELLRADVAIAPIDETRQPAKSSNKVMTYFALGLPVIASPLDAYLRVIRHGENGLIAKSDEEWAAALARLGDVRERERLGRAAKESARAASLDAIGARWAELLTARAEVDIVIPTCGRDDYLAACLASLAACTDVPHRVIVVDAAARQTPLPLPAGVTLVRPERRLNFAEAVNRGAAAGRAPYVCLLNDDTIVTRGWLRPMLERLEGGVGICNPLSNCDRGWLHDYDLSLDGLQLLPGGNALDGGRLGARSGAGPRVPVERLYDYRPGHSRGYEREWVAFFCTVMRRRVLDEVGELDEAFVNGCEDLDFCRRAARLGWRSAVDERSFVFHFGGLSRGRREAESPEAYREEDRANHRRVTLKYERPVIAIHTGAAWERWSSADVDGEGIGGAETATARVAEELARRGRRVIVFGSCKEGTWSGVEYLDGARFASMARQSWFDAVVISRYAGLLEVPVRAARRVFWAHDIHALEARDAAGDRLRRHRARLDGVWCLSPWHRDFFAAHHGLSPEGVSVVPNGVDPDRFAARVERRRHRFIYSSSPDRGLDTLLELFPEIRRRLPDAELHVFYGFDNWDRALAVRGDDTQRRWRDTIRARLSQPGVVYRGRIGQRALAEELLRSQIWLYPTRFTETFCITALEAQMAGVACVSSELAGLTTTVGDRGVLIPGDAYSDEYRRRALDAVLALATDDRAREALTARAQAWAREQTWAAVAREWEARLG